MGNQQLQQTRNEEKKEDLDTPKEVKRFTFPFTISGKKPSLLIPEIIYEITKYMNVRDILHLSQVSKILYMLVQRNFVWNEKINQLKEISGFGNIVKKMEDEYELFMFLMILYRERMKSINNREAFEEPTNEKIAQVTTNIMNLHPTNNTLLRIDYKTSISFSFKNVTDENGVILRQTPFFCAREMRRRRRTKTYVPLNRKCPIVYDEEGYSEKEDRKDVIVERTGFVKFRYPYIWLKVCESRKITREIKDQLPLFDDSDIEFFVSTRDNSEVEKLEIDDKSSVLVRIVDVNGKFGCVYPFKTLLTSTDGIKMVLTEIGKRKKFEIM